MAGKVNKIVCRNSQKALNAQTEVGQRLRGCDKSIGTIASELGWHRNTLDSYFPPNRDTQPTKLPLGAYWDILECDALPGDLKALLMPDRVAALRIPEATDHDEFAAGCEAYLIEYRKAVHPASPDGREIADCEGDELAERRAALGGVS